MSKLIVTGACGFIGSVLTARLLESGHEVIGIDNLSRRGSSLNAEELKTQKGFQLIEHNLCQAEETFRIFKAIGPVDAVFHLAAQVAVTTSYQERLLDFQGNACASFHVIEAIKRYSPEAYCLYASTNKVYGKLHICQPVGLDMPLNPYTPYGVSKATGEMYFTEYGRPEMGLTTCCFRQSCIYGHHQFGVEDQGWLAWFAIANLLQKPITIYGDGKQIRDLLFVDDLVALYLNAWQKRLTGVYPVGGGASNAISLATGIELIETLMGQSYASVQYEAMRPGDQPYFVADLEWTAAHDIQWRPTVTVQDGLISMRDWIRSNMKQIQMLFS